MSLSARLTDRQVECAIVGKPSGIAVLDVDPPHGEESLETFQEEHRRLPDTAIALSGGGGLHFWFKTNGQSVNKGSAHDTTDQLLSTKVVALRALNL